MVCLSKQLLTVLGKKILIRTRYHIIVIEHVLTGKILTSAVENYHQSTLLCALSELLTLFNADVLSFNAELLPQNLFVGLTQRKSVVACIALSCCGVSHLQIYDSQGFLMKFVASLGLKRTSMGFNSLPNTCLWVFQHLLRTRIEWVKDFGSEWTILNRLQSRNMSAKVQKRVKKTASEYEESVAQLSTYEATTSHADDSLFTLDRTGSKSAKRKIAQVLAPQAKGEFVSVTEKKLIGRALTSKKPVYSKFVAKIGSDEVRDLWGDGDVGVSVSEDSKKTRKLRTAHPGQSYNPSAGDHQNAVATAVALQIKKEEADISKSNAAKVLMRKTAPKSLDYDDIGTVPLSDELGGGLRTVIPKGVALTQREQSMRKAGDVMEQDRRTRRAHEKPHAARRTSWHAKYKYT